MPSPRTIGAATFDYHTLLFGCHGHLDRISVDQFRGVHQILRDHRTSTAGRSRLNKAFRYMTLETGLTGWRGAHPRRLAPGSSASATGEVTISARSIPTDLRIVIPGFRGTHAGSPNRAFQFFLQRPGHGPPVKAVTDFDRHANSYDRELEEALSLSGEDREYFARGRGKLLAERLRQIGMVPRHLMDFGCGTGSSTPILLEMLGAESAIGLDTSLRSLDVAKQSYGSERIHFLPVNEYKPAGLWISLTAMESFITFPLQIEEQPFVWSGSP